MVEDLGSTNGTFVNDQPIHSPRQLSPGDRVRIGLTVFELRSPQQVQRGRRRSSRGRNLTEVGQRRPGAGARGTAAGRRARRLRARRRAPRRPPHRRPRRGAAGREPAARSRRRRCPERAGRRRCSSPGVGFRAAETPAGYVPPEVVGDEEAESDYGALSRLVDARVKQQRNIAAFAILAASGLAVLLYFGLQ